MTTTTNTTDTTPAGPIRYELDPVHTTIGFSVRHMMVTRQRGSFRSAAGVLLLDRADPTDSRVEVTIDAASIDTHVAQRDDHLRSADFLDAARHPHITFLSRAIRASAGGRLRVEGDLAIRGVTRVVVLDVDAISAEHKDPFGMFKVGASATAVIDRKDFGITWNTVLDAGGVAVGDEVSLVIDAQFQRKA
jgi:polyisoprenoid-binding protein YceI